MADEAANGTRAESPTERGEVDENPPVPSPENIASGDTAGVNTPIPPGMPPLGSPSKGDIEAEVIDVLRTVYDPEIPVSIYELGLVYKIDIDDGNFVTVEMTLTAPGCPVAVSLPMEVEMKVQSVPGVTGARVEVVWDPPWNMSMMSEAARLQLGFM